MPDATSADLNHRTERFDIRALYETSRLLSASLDLEFVLNNLLLTAMSKLLVTRGAVLLFEPIEGVYRVASARGVRDLEPGDRMPFGAVPNDGVIRGEDVPDALAERRFELAVPVAFGGRDIGLIALGPKATRQPFEPRELEFLHSLVHMTSSAVHNSLMVEELRQANRDLDGKIQELNTLFDLSQQFNATLDRSRLVKMLTLTLMGQMLVGRYLFMLKQGGGTGDGVGLRGVASKGVRQPALEPELTDALCRQTEMVLLDAEGAGEEEKWAGLRERGLALLLPLLQQGETCGMLCLGPKMTGQPYTRDDVEFLQALGNLALVSIQNSYLVEEQIEKERLEEEMRLARSIQEKLLPQEIPTAEGITLATIARPSRFVGGDYFDVVALGERRLLLAIADVTGKGVPAALLMANLQACLQVMVPMDLYLETAMAHMNRVICKNTDYDKFITAFAGIWDTETLRFEYVNAGHNPPTVIRAETGAAEYLETGGLLLGVMASMPYERGTVDLHPGDVLALFTDGVTEAMSPDEEEYGEERLEAVLREHRAGSAQDLLNAIYEDIQVFTDHADVLSDDLTMIILKVEAR